MLISHEIVLEELRSVWSRYVNVNDRFCQFCGIYSTNDLEYRLEVILASYRPDFGTNRKRVCYFLLSYLAAFQRYYSLFTPKATFSALDPYSDQNDVPLGIDPWFGVCWERAPS